MTQNAATREALRRALNAYVDAPTAWQQREAMRRLVTTTSGFAEKVGDMARWLDREHERLKALEGTPEFSELEAKWITRVAAYEAAHTVLQQAMGVIAGRK